MNIIKTTKRKEVTEIITHKTDIKGLTIRERLVNNKHKGFTLNYNNNEYAPILSDKEKTTVEDFKDYKDFYAFIKSIAIPLTSLENINQFYLYFVYYPGNLLFDKDLNPVSILHCFDYIGSLKEKYPNDKLYREIFNLLKEHPYIIKITEKEIEYYNRDFNGQKGLKDCHVFLPQEVYTKLYESKKNIEFFSTRMKEEISLAPWSTENIYGDKITNLIKEHGKIIEFFDEE